MCSDLVVEGVVGQWWFIGYLGYYFGVEIVQWMFGQWLVGGQVVDLIIEVFEQVVEVDVIGVQGQVVFVWIVEQCDVLWLYFDVVYFQVVQCWGVDEWYVVFVMQVCSECVCFVMLFWWQVVDGDDGYVLGVQGIQVVFQLIVIVLGYFVVLFGSGVLIGMD